MGMGMGMQRAEIEAFILEELSQAAEAKGLALPPLEDSANLLELGLLDSLGFITLLAAIEARFGLTLDLAGGDPARYVTLGGLLELALA
jgi:acyl carrier protein